MKKVLVVSAMFIACSTVHAETVHLNQNSLMLLRKMCGAVLAQLDAADMMWVKDYTMNEYINKETGEIVGLDVASINPKDSTNIHKCHYDFATIRADGTPDVSKMLVDMVPVNITVSVSSDSAASTPNATTSLAPPKQ
jgi:hypothetical protein